MRVKMIHMRSRRSCMAYTLRICGTRKVTQGRCGETKRNADMIRARQLQ